MPSSNPFHRVPLSEAAATLRLGGRTDLAVAAAAVEVAAVVVIAVAARTCKNLIASLRDPGKVAIALVLRLSLVTEES